MTRFIAAHLISESQLASVQQKNFIFTQAFDFFFFFSSWYVLSPDR